MPLDQARQLAQALGISSESSVRTIDSVLQSYSRNTALSPTVEVTGTLPYASITGLPSSFPSDAASDVDGSNLVDYADDAAAAVGGVEIGELYRTGSIIKVRVA